MSKIKLPKRLAGVKIAKSIRKGAVGDFVRSTAGQALLVEALTIAATASEQDDDAIEQRLASALQEALVTFRDALRVDPDALASLRVDVDRHARAADQPAGLAAPD